MTDTVQTTPDASASAKPAMEIGDIFKILPHRYPFLLIDRVLELVRMKRIVAVKNVTMTEPFFQGHFPGKPIMPGVLIVEAIAQAGGLLLLTEVPNRDEMLMVFTGIEKARFRRPSRVAPAGRSPSPPPPLSRPRMPCLPVVPP